MKILLFIMMLFIGAGLSFTTLAQEKSADENTEQKNEQAVEDGKVFNTVCPVSTEEADPEITHTYEGKTYAVCCNNCLKKFKNDPEKYISRLSEDGTSIVKKKSEKKTEENE